MKRPLFWSNITGNVLNDRKPKQEFSFEKAMKKPKKAIREPDERIGLEIFCEDDCNDKDGQNKCSSED